MATKTWREMREWSVDLLRRRTGEGLEEWNHRVRESGATTEPELRAWLAEQGVTGYAQMILVMERFGYPDFLLASADELIDGQYADRPALRPILDRLLAVVSTLGEVTVQARKTYISLVTPRRTFAVVRATTRTRVDLGLRLAGGATGERLLTAKGLGNESITVRIPLAAPDDVDDDVVAWLNQAYQENS